jgi:hypothetical protein
MAGIKVANEKESQNSSSLNRDIDYMEKQEAVVDQYYDYGNYNGEVDYLEVDQDGLMSFEQQTLLMPPGMRLKNY